MKKQKALAWAAASVGVVFTGGLSVAALSGVAVLGFNSKHNAGVAPLITDTPAKSVVVVTKKHVVGPSTSVAATVATTAPTIVAAPVETTEAQTDPWVDAGQKVVAVATGDSLVAPVSPTAPPAVSPASTEVTTTSTTVGVAPTSAVAPTLTTTIAISAPTTPTTQTTATTTAAPVTTTTIRVVTTVAAKVTVTGQVIPAGWELPSGWPANTAYPAYPANCKKGHLEDNGVWNCG